MKGREFGMWKTAVAVSGADEERRDVVHAAAAHLGLGTGDEDGRLDDEVAQAVEVPRPHEILHRLALQLPRRIGRKKGGVRLVPKVVSWGRGGRRSGGRT